MESAASAFDRTVEIVLIVVRSPLGVPDDDIGRSRLLEHAGGNVARMRAVILGVAILPADLHRSICQYLGGPGDQRGWRADEAVGGTFQARREGVSDRAKFLQPADGSVHLPIARH